jgi:DNA-binding NarL/FixJ family response regulator
VSITHIQAYVLSPHRLAGEFLVQILGKDKLIHPILCDRLPMGSANQGKVVSVLDACFLLFPLVECIRTLQSRLPDSKFIVVDRSLGREKMLRLLKLGVHGFVDYSDVGSIMHKVVRSVVEGQLRIPREVLHTYIELSTSSKQPRPSRLAPVTSRELQVLELVEQRLSNKEIANMLKIGSNTVKYHISNILSKLHAENRGDIVPPSGPITVWNQFFHLGREAHQDSSRKPRDS